MRKKIRSSSRTNLEQSSVGSGNNLQNFNDLKEIVIKKLNKLIKYIKKATDSIV
jgi:hypothetical protein